jgi:uncharacterized membrane protein
MKKNRMEAFSDGVLAIIITIMVLELKVPHEFTWHALFEKLPVFSSYVLSFIYVAIYWNNHHHLLHTVENVNGRVMWANNHLLFWLSLVPFASAWAGESYFSSTPVALYGIILFMAGLAYYLLSQTIRATQGEDSILAKATGADYKGFISLILNAVAIPFAFWMPYVTMLIYAIVGVIWLLPDRRIEKALQQENK